MPLPKVRNFYYNGYMADLGRPSKWAKYTDEWTKLFDGEGWSRGQIARKYGTSVQSVTRILSKAGVDVDQARVGEHYAGRTAEEQTAINLKIAASRKGKGTGPRKPRESRTCGNGLCGKQFEFQAGRTGETYCSRLCRTAAANANNIREAKKVYALDPVTCPCGAAIAFEHRHTRQYCGPEHRFQFQAKRQGNPANHVTNTCQNCGDEFTRPKSQSGWGKYCSNQCAQKHTRVKRHVVVDDGSVLDSGWEVLFHGLCSFAKLSVERFDRQHGVAWKEGGWYAPDFWLPELSLAVEVKGHQQSWDLEKWTAFRQQHRLVVLKQPELQGARLSDDLAGFLRNLAQDQAA